jgi:hypothetical protein
MAARWQSFGPECDERRRRLWAASEARAHGPGGVALAARVTGLSEETVRRGVAELESGERLERGQVRRAGGGRRSVIEPDPSVLADLDRLIDPSRLVAPGEGRWGVVLLAVRVKTRTVSGW